MLGAAGGVGLSAVELGKAYGARVIAAVSSEDKLAFAKKHGADDGLVYPPGPFDKAGAKALADLFKEACGENGADVIYDPVGGDYSEAALRSIAWEGRFLVVGFPAGIAKLPLNLTLLKSCDVVGVFWGAFARRDPKANAANIAELMQLYAEGAIKPLISERYPAGAGRRGHRQAGRAQGDGQDRGDDGLSAACRYRRDGGGSGTRRCPTAGASTARAISTATAATPRSSGCWRASCRATRVGDEQSRAHQQTAAAILAAADGRHGGVDPARHADLAEQHLGEWQGLERKPFYAARKVGTHTLWFAPADEPNND